MTAPWPALTENILNIRNRGYSLKHCLCYSLTRHGLPDANLWLTTDCGVCTTDFYEWVLPKPVLYDQAFSVSTLY